MAEITRTFDLLEQYRTTYSWKKDALAGSENGKWYTYSSLEYIENVNTLSFGLLSLGVLKGDKIATISHNCPEWNFIDMAIAQIGAVHVPVYPTISFDDYKYILEHSEAKFIFVGDKKIFKTIHPLLNKIDLIEEIFTIDIIEGARNWKDLLSIGMLNKNPQHLEELRNSILPNDLTTIIYTSGTTGIPKGVMLSHRNLVSNFVQHSNNHPLGSESRVVSFLPLCHVYERSMNYHFQNKGMSIYYVASLAAIMPALKEIKPHMFNTVPRLLERIYDGILSKGKELKGVKKIIFNWAIKLGDNFDYDKKFSVFYKFKRSIADKLVYSKWRAVMGGNVKLIVSGGAALQPRIGRVLGVANICALEGYGLTETSPVIAVSNLVTNEIKVGTVGPILPGVELKFGDDNEILCKGPNVMLGYFKDPELTSQVIDNEGYFHTGDIGTLIDNRFLKITDRKKEIFKLSGGKYIAPQMIENKLKESFFIEQAMVIGENEKFASAILSPNLKYIHDWCASKGINGKTNEEIILLPEVVSAIQKEVIAINKTLGQVEEIKRFRITHDEWSPDTGELSPTLKLKRNYIHKKYRAIISDIYSAGNTPIEKENGIRLPRIKIKRPEINLNINELINRLKF